MEGLFLLISVVLITLGAIASIKNQLFGFLTSIIAILISFISLTPEMYFFGALIVLIGLLNMITLYTSKNQIKGVDYALSAILVFATILIIQTSNFAVLIGTFILVSVPTYVLVILTESKPNVEIAIKYIVFMVFATILFIIGAFMLVYSSEFGSIYYILGYVLLVSGLALEVGVAPFHEWVPDVFTEADPIPVSIIASIAKFVPFILAFKILIATVNPITESIVMFTAFLSALSMFIGNIGALTSKEHGRVLGYSTVANMGYVLATLVVIVKLEFVYLAIAGALLQLLANSAGKIGFFSAIKEKTVGSIFTYSLAFSFIGMPPLMGFWSKLFILLSLLYSGYLWLGVILVINSAISVPYYIRLARELGRGYGYGIMNVVALIAVLLTLITLYPPDWFAQSIKGIIDTFSIGGVV